MMRRRRVILAGTAALAAGTLAVAASWRKQGPAIFTPVEAAAPGLKPLAAPAEAVPTPPAHATFLDGEGETKSLADFKGQGVVVNLWATWCVPCVAEMPALQAMAKAVAKDRIAVLPLSSDRGGAPVVRRFYAQHDIQGLGVWLDPKGEAARAWGARGLPTTLIIDREGREVARLEGAIDWASDESVATLKRLVGAS
jgi:thiol-disulfide isomerase/thioredoxin